MLPRQPAEDRGLMGKKCTYERLRDDLINLQPRTELEGDKRSLFRTDTVEGAGKIADYTHLKWLTCSPVF